MQVRRFKKSHRFMSLLCVLTMIAGLINPVALKKSAVEVQAAEPGVIEISTPKELQKIGKDSAYPMSGDYVLTADIDLDGVKFDPIGGTEGAKGATSGANVFSGTFDGQGHMISNLTIDITKTQNAPNYAQIGMFSVIASEDANDYAVVKNIVFANAHITTNISGNCTTAGTLAGEVNGYSTVENIAVLDGTIYINGSNQADTVGAGGVIGECRTEAAMGNNYITIKNIYNSAEVLAGSSGNAYLAGGIIGRIRMSSCKEISGCVNVGRTSYKGELASAITAVHTGADNSCISDCYFLFATGSPSGEGTSELAEDTLKSGVLPTGLDPDVWYAAEGSYPLLQICKNEGPAGYLGLASLAPEFADGENATCVTQDFTLPEFVGDVKVTWTSSNTDVISIEGTTAKVKGVLSPAKVVLTATTPEGVSRKYTITVVSNVTAQFDQIYAKAGTPLTVSVTNAPENINLAYAWSVGDEVRAAVTGNSYTPTAEDNEKFIKVVITATNYDASWEVSMYMSNLPVVYIDTEDGDDVMNKGLYEYANIKIQGNDQFSTEDVLYDGLTEIKGRGNSTWDYAAANNLKKPYRLKFDKKADVLGMGKSKHWVLLANLCDHTNMRNELIYQFADDIGMECVLDFEPCVVILNGKYHGFYQIGEHKRVDEGRIDIFDWEALGEDIAGAIAKAEGFSDDETSDIEEYVAEMDYSWLDTGVVNYNGNSYTVSDYYKGTIPEFTGGFAFDMDFRLDQSKFISKFRTRYGYPMFFEAPEYAKTSTTMMSFAQTYLQAFEDALHDDDFYAAYDGEEVHYSELFDVPSLLQNWYVVEYSMNWDAMKNSTLMYKDLDTEEGRSLMKMGPVWDFDWAWGNINMYSMTQPYVITGWHTTQDSFCEQSYQWENWNRYLISDPYFAMLAYEEWDNVRAVIEDMIKDGGRIDQLEEYYREAAEANDEKWASTYRLYRGYGITNGQPTYKQSELYADAVVSMEYFVKNRVTWFDQQFTSVDGLLKSWGRYRGSDTLAVADVQFPEDGKTEITATVTDRNIKKIAFYVNGIRAGQVDVANNTASITVTDDMLRASATGEELSNCVQIRAMDTNGNFLKNGSAVVTNYGIFEKTVLDESVPDETTDTVVINEVESSDAEGGNDWVEIYNKGDEAVDISGWFVTDDKGLDRLTAGATTPLPEGTVLESGAFLVLEENVNFTCGLGGSDTVYLYDGNKRVIDSCTWSGHAAGALARVPDGNGAFVDQAPTKGALNIPKVLVEETLLDFTFDDKETGFKGGQAVAQPAGTIVDVDGRKALYLNGRSDNWLNVTKEDGSSLLAGIEEMTISYDVKTNGSLWAFYAAPNTNAQTYLSERYIGIIDKGNVVTVERYNSRNEQRPHFNTAPISYGEWVHVEVTLGKDSTSIKINDGEAVVQEGLHTITDILGKSPILQIGKGNWNTGEYFTGYLDNYKITTMVEEPVVTLPYEDVAEDAWYYNAVYYNYAKKLMTGKSQKIFAPDATLTRAEFVSVLYSANSMPEVTYKAAFSDVPEDAWFADAVIWASQQKIVNGYGTGKFGPADPVVREQIAVMMYNYAAFKGYRVNQRENLSSFTDASDVSDYAKDAMQWAVGAGVITGKESGTKLDPHGATSRAECAAIIQKFMVNCAK